MVPRQYLRRECRGFATYSRRTPLSTIELVAVVARGLIRVGRHLKKTESNDRVEGAIAKMVLRLRPLVSQ
jgi:hypothetical protein